MTSARPASSWASAEVVGVLEVERDRALVAVDAEVVRRDAVAHRRLPGAGVVAGRRLDLDHLGAEVGEQHRGVGAGQDPGEVGDQQPGQRVRCGRSATRDPSLDGTVRTSDGQRPSGLPSLDRALSTSAVERRPLDSRAASADRQ